MGRLWICFAQNLTLPLTLVLTLVSAKTSLLNTTHFPRHPVKRKNAGLAPGCVYNCCVGAEEEGGDECLDIVALASPHNTNSFYVLRPLFVSVCNSSFFFSLLWALLLSHVCTNRTTSGLHFPSISKCTLSIWCLAVKKGPNVEARFSNAESKNSQLCL